MSRIDLDQFMKADTLVYKYAQTNLEKNMELYSKYGYFVIAVQNGKYAGHAMVLGTRKLNKKSFSGLKTSLFKKDVNVQLYFVRATFAANCAVDDRYDIGSKKAHFKGQVNVKLELADAAKFAKFTEDFAAKRTCAVLDEAEFASFIIGAALTEMIPAGSIHPFVYEKNIYGGGNREAYVANLSLRVYFKPEKFNRYTGIGLRARSIHG